MKSVGLRVNIGGYELGLDPVWRRLRIHLATWWVSFRIPTLPWPETAVQRTAIFPMRGTFALIGCMAVAVPGCEPVAWIHVRQTLPSTDACLSTTLSASPYVAFVQKRDAGWYEVSFHDSLFAHRMPIATISATPQQDASAMLFISFMWLGRLRAASAAQRQQVGSLGAELLAEVHAQCGANGPLTPVLCEEGNWGTTRAHPCGSR